MFVVGFGFGKFVGQDSPPYWWYKVQMDICNKAWALQQKPLRNKERILLYYFQFDTDTIHVITSYGRTLYKAFTMEVFLGSTTITETLDITKGYLPEPKGYERPPQITAIWADCIIDSQPQQVFTL